MLKITRKNSFTLVELILVTVILSFLALLSVPNFQKLYSNVKLQTKADDLAYVMRYAQSYAVTHDATLRLNFSPTLEEYWLSQSEQPDDVDAEGEEVEYERLDGRMGRTWHMGEEVSLEMEEENIQFYSDGRIDKDRLYLCKNEKCYTISTKEQRGYVRVFDGRLE